MNNIIVWEPSSAYIVAKVLFNLSKEPQIFTSYPWDDPEARKSSIEAMKSNSDLDEHADVSDWFTVCSTIKVKNTCFDTDKIVQVTLKNEHETQLVINNHWMGSEVLFTSNQVPSKFVRELYFNSRVNGLGKKLLKNIIQIQQWCEFTVWFGLPDWDTRNNIVIVAKNEENLKSIANYANSLGERFFKDKDAINLSTDPKIYISEYNQIIFP